MALPPGWATDPTWSPDAEYLAFRLLDPKTGDVGVYVVRRDGRNLRLIADQAGMPAWSPHGTQIAYAGLAPGRRGLWVVDARSALRDGEVRARQITHVADLVPEERPAWSPDGRQLAFTSHRTGDSDIWRVNVDGAGLANLTRNGALDSHPTWSPDGQTIAFNSTRGAGPNGEGTPGEIYLMRADGSSPRRLTRSRGGNFGPAWSPDGSLIAFNSQRDGNSEIYVMARDGSQARRLTRNPGADGFAAWVGNPCSSGS